MVYCNHYGHMKNNIRDIRKAKGLSAQKLAERIGTTQQQVTRLERGDRRLSDVWMEKLAKALKCKPSDLINEDGFQAVESSGKANLEAMMAATRLITEIAQTQKTPVPPAVMGAAIAELHDYLMTKGNPAEEAASLDEYLLTMFLERAQRTVSENYPEYAREESN